MFQNQIPSNGIETRGNQGDRGTDQGFKTKFRLTELKHWNLYEFQRHVTGFKTKFRLTELKLPISVRFTKVGMVSKPNSV
jgi:hypothetical protein